MSKINEPLTITAVITVPSAGNAGCTLDFDVQLAVSE
jgi:hypothetical protein